MYLLYFVLCDISLILATNEVFRYSTSPDTKSELHDIHLLEPTQQRIKRESSSNTSSYAESNSPNVTLIHLQEPPSTINIPKPNVEHTPLNIPSIKKYVNRTTVPVPETSSTYVTTPKKSIPLQPHVAVEVSQVPNDTDNYNITSPLFMTNETLNDTLQKHNISRYEDYHIYYNSSRMDDITTGQHYWVDFTNRTDAVIHQMLSNAHRRANTVTLPFKFQFYGHEIDNVTIATGGFLYTGDYIHSWLAATQYIAPLMANFDTSISNDSFIKTVSNSTTFTVMWENVSLQDRPSAGNFTFQVTLCKNGDIIFVYKNIPNITHEITEDFHPVKVGLSDAYIMDRTIFFVRRKTIFEYHRVHFDKKDLKNWTVIYFKPLPTCQNKTTCESCLSKETSFNCQWCDGRCSTGLDRKRHDWMKKECEKKRINETKHCSLANEKLPMADHHIADHSGKSLKPGVPQNSKSSTSLVFLMILTLGCIFSACVWTMYAYRNPHSTSGQILIRYRPSRWSSWRKGEARYTAATVHM